jgi:two-component system sensor histidine kinase DesK
LTNIHRHSGSTTATTRIKAERERIILEVQDQGKGIPAEKLQHFARLGRIGVGLGGMRERLRLLGGTLEIQSDEKGTLVSATLPIQRDAEGPPASKSLPREA